MPLVFTLEERAIIGGYLLNKMYHYSEANVDKIVKYMDVPNSEVFLKLFMPILTDWKNE